MIDKASIKEKVSEDEEGKPTIVFIIPANILSICPLGKVEIRSSVRLLNVL